ncbi:hypothetical protein KR059_008953 [Drosophila kikkawai]|nr:hypothetical protein KR059_008953 [Drosophila kikkawai]
MKLLSQFLLGLVLVLAVMSSLVNAGSKHKDDWSDESLVGNSESDESFLSEGNVQQDYLNVGDYVRPPPPWWF